MFVGSHPTVDNLFITILSILCQRSGGRWWCPGMDKLLAKYRTPSPLADGEWQSPRGIPIYYISINERELGSLIFSIAGRSPLAVASAFMGNKIVANTLEAIVGEVLCTSCMWRSTSACWPSSRPWKGRRRNRCRATSPSSLTPLAGYWASHHHQCRILS